MRQIQRPAGVRTATTRIAPGVDLYYRIEGEGEAIVLVAGLADDHASWREVTAALARDRTVITFDNRGSGRSSTPPGPYTTRQMASDAHALAQSLDLGPVDAVGSSMGGAICQWWAIDHPRDIRRLVLTNTWARREPFLEQLFGHWVRLAEQGADRRLLESNLLFCFSPAFLAANEGRLDELIGAAPAPLAGYVAAAIACRDHDAIAALEHIEQKTLVIAGREDILTRPLQSHLLVQRLKNAELAEMQTGHMTFWEQPDTFIALVKEFLERTSYARS